MGVELGEASRRDHEIDQRHGTVLQGRRGFPDPLLDGGGNDFRQRGDRHRGPEKIPLEDPPLAVSSHLHGPGLSGSFRGIGPHGRPPGQQTRPGVPGGFGERLADLTVPPPRIEEVVEPHRSDAGNPAEQLARQKPWRAGGDTPARLLGSEGLGLPAPDLPGEREIEILRQRGSQLALEERSEGVVDVLASKTTPGTERGVLRRPGEEGGVGVPEQVHGTGREANPSPPEADPPVAGSLEEIFSEQPSEIGQDRRIAGRMETMAAVVDVLAGELEAPRASAEAGVPFHQDDVRPVEGAEPVGRPRSRGPPSQDDHAGAAQDPAPVLGHRS